MELRALATFILLLAAGPVFAANCEPGRGDLLTPPQTGEGPTEVFVRLLVNDVVAIRDAEQSFSADIFVRVEWDDHRLAHADSSPCSARIADIWWPDLQLMNRRALQSVREPAPQVRGDGRVSMLLRGIGDFSYRADLADFPFDEQTLSIDLLSVYGPEDVVFVYEPGQIALGTRLSVANFAVEIAGVDASPISITATQREHAGMVVQMRATRLAGFYTWQQLVPLFLVVMMAWIVFWIPREHVPSRIGLAATSMLTLIAYRFAMSAVLPPIAYLTRLDRFMIGASVLVFMALATAVAVTYVMDIIDEGLADRINLAARWLAPVLLILVTLLAFVA